MEVHHQGNAGEKSDSHTTHFGTRRETNMSQRQVHTHTEALTRMYEHTQTRTQTQVNWEKMVPDEITQPLIGIFVYRHSVLKICNSLNCYHKTESSQLPHQLQFL